MTIAPARPRAPAGEQSAGAGEQSAGAGEQSEQNHQAEALFREARRRRRRRWSVGLAVAATVVAGLSIAGRSALTTGGGSGSGQPRSAPHKGGPDAGGSRERTDQRSVVPATQGAAVMQMGLLGQTGTAHPTGTADDQVGWAVNGLGIYLTADGGATWRNITPPLIANQEPGDRVGTMTAIGANDLWLPVWDVIGMVPPTEANGGSTRGQGIERSTDGGRTWSFSALPGCISRCGGDLSVSFPDSQHGFATIGPASNDQVQLFATDDGGATWHPASTLPFSADGASVVFTTALDGWAVSTGTFDNGDTFQPGYGLYRTTDGGRTWAPAPGLPAGRQLELPTFFGTSEGVVVERPSASPTRDAAIEVTDNGGRTWSKRQLPADPALAAYTGTDGSPIPFAASSATDWKLLVGPSLFTTTDAGRTWRTTTTTPAWSPGDVSAISFSSPANGWAQAALPTCTSFNDEQSQCESLPLLMSTTNGGRTWKPLPFDPSPPSG